jgi:hypothetical protein
MEPTLSLEALANYPERMILGDANEDARYRNDPGADDFHRRIRDAAYTEAVSSVFSGPVRTNFCVRDGGSYQNDHAYLSGPVAERLDQVAVFHELGFGRSDHAGILLTFKGA